MLGISAHDVGKTDVYIHTWASPERRYAATPCSSGCRSWSLVLPDLLIDSPAHSVNVKVRSDRYLTISETAAHPKHTCKPFIDVKHVLRYMKRNGNTGKQEPIFVCC